MPRTKSPGRSLLLNLVLVGVAFGLLGLVIWKKQAEIGKVFGKPVDYRFFAVGLAIYLVALLITFARWHRLVRAQGLTFSLRDSIRLGFIGNVFNLVIPGAVGGDVIKAAFLCRMQPDRKPQAVASMILDRILGLLGLFFLAGVAGLLSWDAASRDVKVLIGLVWAAVAAGFLGLGVVFSPTLYRPLNRLVAGRGKAEVIVRELESIGLAYREQLGTVAAMFGVSVLGHTLYVLAFYSASLALFDAMPTLVQHYLMVPLALFTTAVPLPFGALGLSEQISGQLFRMVHHADGAIAMMAFRILMYASGAFSACVYLVNLRQVQALTRDASTVVDAAIGASIATTGVVASGEAAG